MREARERKNNRDFNTSALGPALAQFSRLL